MRVPGSGMNPHGRSFPGWGCRLKIIRNTNNWKAPNWLASLDELLNGDIPIAPLEGRGLEEQFVTQEMLGYALSQLSEKEGLVLSMYYQHDMNLKEIALVLGLTEARICQMNKKITHKIRDCLYPD